MDYGKAKIIIKKLGTLIDSFESLGEPISEIESEMLLKYIEKLEQLIPKSNATQHPAKDNKQPDPTSKKDLSTTETNAHQGESREEKENSLHPPKLVNAQGDKSDDEQFDVAPEIETEIPVVEPVITPSRSVTPPTPVKAPVNVPTKETTKKAVLVSVDEDDSEGSTSDLWEPVEIKELSHKLSFSPIKNIFKAISINERILTQNELFGGDAVAFKSALDHLETCNSFQEAVLYLRMGAAKDYKWEEAKKIKKANNFMALVQRRFL